MATAAWALTSVSLALLVAFLVLALYGRFYLALVVGLLGQVTGLVYGIVAHSWVNIGISAAGILLLLWSWWWTRGRRKPVAKAVGDESRQLRDGLVRKVRQRRVTRRGLSPEPSR
jgi:hypothetical protein